MPCVLLSQIHSWTSHWHWLALVSVACVRPCPAIRLGTRHAGRRMLCRPIAGRRRRRHSRRRHHARRSWSKTSRNLGCSRRSLWRRHSTFLRAARPWNLLTQDRAGVVGRHQRTEALSSFQEGLSFWWVKVKVCFHRWLLCIRGRLRSGLWRWLRVVLAMHLGGDILIRRAAG